MHMAHRCQVINLIRLNFLNDADQATTNGAVDSANFDDGSSANSISSAVDDMVVEFAALLLHVVLVLVRAR